MIENAIETQKLFWLSFLEWLPVLLAAISAILAGLTVTLIIVAWIAYANLRRLARKSAREEARQIAANIAEQEANRYIQRELPQILAAYRPFLRDPGSDEDANEIAQTQDGGISNEENRS